MTGRVQEKKVGRGRGEMNQAALLHVAWTQGGAGRNPASYRDPATGRRPWTPKPSLKRAIWQWVPSNRQLQQRLENRSLSGRECLILRLWKIDYYRGISACLSWPGIMGPRVSFISESHQYFPYRSPGDSGVEKTTSDLLINMEATY